MKNQKFIVGDLAYAWGHVCMILKIILPSRELAESRIEHRVLCYDVLVIDSCVINKIDNITTSITGLFPIL